MNQDIIKLTKQIDQFIIKVMMEQKIPGISIGIMKDGEVLYSRGYGYRNMKDELPMTPDTLYGIGSSSKSFIALAVMQLVEQGKLQLDAPVSEYIDFQFGTTDNPITLHHLLSHSSGIQDLNCATLPFMWAEKKYKYAVPIANKDDYLTVINSYKDIVQFAPGEAFMYNNDLYYVLGLVIESVIEGTYEDYIIENIMRPLGMERSTYYKEAFFKDPKKDIMQGYAFDEQTKEMVEKAFPFGKTINAPGAILSSVNEMLSYLQLYLGKGQVHGKHIISPESIDKMWTSVIKTPYGEGENSQYAYGWMREDDFLDSVLVQHGGNVAASSNAMMIMPEKGLGVIVGENMDNDLTDKIARGILALINGHSPAEVIPLLGILAKMGPILGKYADHSGATSLNLSMEGPTLSATLKIADMPEQKYPLVPIDLDTYRFGIASVLPLSSEIRVYINPESKKIYAKVDRNVFFKK